MRIIDIREMVVPISSPMRNAYVNFSQMTASIVAVVTDVVRDGRRVVGYGFNSNGRYAASGLLRERFVRRLLAAEPESITDPVRDNLDPHRASDVMMANEKPGGHGERSVAVGTLDMALWDAVAKIEGRRLCDVIAERYGTGKAEQQVFVYAAGGYYLPDKGLRELKDEMRGYLDTGYTMVKMKIGGATLTEDVARVEAVLEVLGDGDALAVDANGHFDLATALAYADALRPYGLRWYEEAGDPLDYQLQAVLSEHYPGPMATGENLFSSQDVRNLLRYAGMRPDRDTLQMDCALSYGFVEYLRMLDVMAAHGWTPRRCMPHGGHQMSLAIAAGLGLGGNESYPGVFAPFGGFADETPIRDGYVEIPEHPGVGFEAKADLIGVLRGLLDN